MKFDWASWFSCFIEIKKMEFAFFKRPESILILILLFSFYIILHKLSKKESTF